MDKSKLLSLSDKIYKLLLHAYPAPFRKEYGRHMAQLFRDDMRNTLQEGGTAALIGLWLFTFFDLVKTALAEHTWGVVNIMPLEKMNRWSGPAAAIGGIIFSLGAIWLWGFENALNGSLTLAGLTFFVSTPLFGLGLYGLYKCFPQNWSRQNNLAFATALTGLIIYHFSILISILIKRNGICYFCTVGYGTMLLGIGGMGLIALLNQSLGKLSITPLLVMVFNLLPSFLKFSGNFQNPHLIIVMILLTLSWLLMGIGIMRTEENHKDSTLLA